MSMSRWGPLLSSHQQQYQQQLQQQQEEQHPADYDGRTSISRSITPVPPTSGNQQPHPHSQQQQPQERQEKYTLDLTFLKDEDPEFELTESVEWGQETNTPNDELAAKPRPDKSDDPCGCMRPSDPTMGMTCIDLSCVLFACQEECRSNCMAGERCGNKRIQRKQWKRMEVFDAGKKGKGLKVLEDVQKGDLVTEYVGRAVNKLFLPSLFRRYVHERKLYIMALTNAYLDARKQGGVARYINHSCDPNCVVERWKVRGILRAAVIAYKDIPAGTELSFDYQWERKRGRAPTKCHCGAANCRGTLEVPRSMAEEALERKLSQHWKKPLIQRAGKEIVNRCIKLLSKETQEYYPADVIQYDESTGQHLVMYRHDLDEVWEDLKKEDWMILDEEAEQFIIRKKILPSTSNSNSNSSSSLLGVAANSMNNNILVNAPSGMMLQGQQHQQQLYGMNYVYTHTPIKEALYAKHLIERCQRSCRVNITAQQFSKPGLTDDSEHEERQRLLQQSSDGTVWKLTILGSDVAKARNILEKNVAYLVSKGGSDPGPNAGALFGSTSSGDTAAVNGVSSGAAGTTQQAASNGGTKTVAVEENSTEVVLPRSIVDTVKRRLPVLREKCRSVNITFVPSESKSKQFAKLIVEGTLLSDVETAKDHLWKQLNIACEENNAPKSQTGVYKDLGILGGLMSSSDFHRLLDYGRTGLSVSSSSSTAFSSTLNQDAKEDLTRWSPFFASFEATQRCTIWIQSDSDKGRIDGLNRIVSQATPNAPRKIYFGCDPKAVPKLWRLVEMRAAEVARGVKYLYLGPDRLYQPQLMQNNGQFFEFVKKVTGATVGVDSMTGDHLRIDGEGSEKLPIDLSLNASEGERASMAEALIKLQIELYRDHCIRQESWVFGRNWTLARRSAQSSSPEILENNSPIGNRNSFTSTGITSFDSRTLTNACLEIVDVVFSLELDEYVAAHAVIIMYRFTTMLAQNESSETQLKIREILLACVFLANKAQKVSKWRKLESVLESAYKTFYAGATFDSSKEESLVWEEKVIAAEAEILERLNFDIFTRSFTSIVDAVVDSGCVDRKVARNAIMFSFSGPVLAVGPDLWLTYGAEYVFAAAASFLNAKLENLCVVLSLIPIKVFQAAELITNSLKSSGFRKRHQSHPLVKEGKKGLQNSLTGIKIACANLMSGSSQGLEQSFNLSETQQRYKIIGNRDKERRVYHDVPAGIIQDCILPSIDGICAESKCNIFINKCQSDESFNIVLEGSWRAISIASFLLREAVKDDAGNISKWFTSHSEDIYAKKDQGTIQAKLQPGLLQMKTIDDGWLGTIQSHVSNQTAWARKIGGKCCVPGKIKESDMRHAGLGWWIPPRYGPSTSGSICDMFLGMNDAGSKEAIGNLCVASQGETSSFSMLAAFATRKTSFAAANDRFVAVSLHRWPSEKVASREQDKTKREDAKKGKKSKRVGMQTGFSPGALQEMQLLRQLHGLIHSPQGHPNLYLPVGVALPSEPENGEIDPTAGGSRSSLDLKRIDEDIFSLTRTSLENEAAAKEEQKRKEMVNVPHLVFHPTPFILQRLIGKKKRKDESDDQQSISPRIFATWCFDLLSAVLHCHENGIVLRTLMLDTIVVDHSGVAKLGSLYKSCVLSKDDKNLKIEDLARKRGKSDDDDVLKDPYAAPEMVLGSPKHTKETDIWALGCLLSHLLLNKPLYCGKDRESVLLAMYKLIGTPSSKNFEAAAKFPYYKKIKGKKYVPGVARALEKMMNESESTKQYSGAIDLISQMLQLDPKKRITAKGALQHEYLSNFIEECSKQSFQEEFVQDWISLKNKFMKSTKSEEDEILERERGIKRKAMLMAASRSMTAEDDDLYDMGDILEGGVKANSKSSKKSKS